MLTDNLIFMLTKKPSSITITVRDRKKNKSKSFTVYNTSLEDVFEKIRKNLEK